MVDTYLKTSSRCKQPDMLSCPSIHGHALNVRALRSAAVGVVTFVTGGTCVFLSVNIQKSSMQKDLQGNSTDINNGTSGDSASYTRIVPGIATSIAPLRMFFNYAYNTTTRPASTYGGSWIPLAVFDNTTSLSIAYDPSSPQCSVVFNIPGSSYDNPCDAGVWSWRAPWTWQVLMVAGIMLMVGGSWTGMRVMHHVRFPAIRT